MAHEDLKNALKGRKILTKKEGGLHQTILDIAHSLRFTGSSYNRFVYLVHNTYGKLAALAVLLGTYNYQVTNGGHFQYFDNGYASDFNNDKLESHNLLVDLMHEFFFSTPLQMMGCEKDIPTCSAPSCGFTWSDIIETPKINKSFEIDETSNKIIAEVYRILCDFEVDIDSFDDRGFRTTPTYAVVNPKTLDKAYYKVYKRWLDIFENFLRKELLS